MLAAPHALVLDDSADWREFLSDTLSDQGWLVRASARSKVAEHLELGSQPDLVLLDVSLPEYAPEAVAAGLRIHYGPRLPILALARSPQAQLVQRIGAYAFLRKPVEMNNLQRLLYRVQELTERSARLRAHSEAALEHIRRLRVVQHRRPS